VSKDSYPLKDVFVTLNIRDFTNHGKQHRLAGVGIWVFDPEGLINFLYDLYGW